MKVLNLFSGIGGNRKLWTDVDVTAVELNSDIAAIYKDLYPNDNVIVADAHQFLLEHYSEYDFVWSSPPCPTHSRTNYFLNSMGVIRYPDMNLYQEIILLQQFFQRKYCVENVISYYDPLIKPQESDRHYFWANFKIPPIKAELQIGRMCGKKEDIGETQANLRKSNLNSLGIDLSKYDYKDKDKLLRNCVSPEIGLLILNCARGILRNENVRQDQLF